MIFYAFVVENRKRGCDSMQNAKLQKIAGAVILILIIIIIVVGVKLRRRNEELDEFYDEHESIGNSKGSRAVVEKKSRKQFKGYQDEEDDFVDDFEDEEETDDEDPDEYEE